MHFITLDEFQQLFSAPIPTFANFKRNAVVKTSSRVVPLKEYIQGKKVVEEDLKNIHQFIVHKHEYLARFYKMSLRLVDITQLQNEIHMPSSELSNNKLNNYKNIVRNMYYDHILEKTQSGIGGIPTYWSVLWGLIEKNEIKLSCRWLIPSCGYLLTRLINFLCPW